ncbi:hypothetical protein, partial [Klebsiella michiganensis]|uniref:hypothetical protein n=2 Tax=Klebsiella michiganensis TaxID=1134687 RepID=UPI00254D8617
LMMSLWDALRMNMMISYQELVRTFLSASSSAMCFTSSPIRTVLMPLPVMMIPSGNISFRLTLL